MAGVDLRRWIRPRSHALGWGGRGLRVLGPYFYLQPKEGWESAYSTLSKAVPLLSVFLERGLHPMSCGTRTLLVFCRHVIRRRSQPGKGLMRGETLKACQQGLYEEYLYSLWAPAKMVGMFFKVSGLCERHRNSSLCISCILQLQPNPADQRKLCDKSACPLSEVWSIHSPVDGIMPITNQPST